MKTKSTIQQEQTITEGPGPIGGFFELEIPQVGADYHEQALALSTGRDCLRVILNSLQPRRAFVPNYTCDATLEPFRELDIELFFYHLDEHFLPQAIPSLEETDCFLICNYWGLQSEAVQILSKRIAERLIIDNTHDFYSKSELELSWSFTSARKWFGVPDGAYLYHPKVVDKNRLIPFGTQQNKSISLEHGLNRLNGDLDTGFQQFQEYESRIGKELRRISIYSRAMLSLIDLTAAAEKRRSNFEYLDRHLRHNNQINFDFDPGTDTPFAYPYLPRKSIDRSRLYQQGIYIPQLWQDVLFRKTNCHNSRNWATHLLPIPIDHRYGNLEMQFMVEQIQRLEQASD